MPYRHLAFGRVLIVKWIAEPTLASVSSIYDEVTALRESTGPVFYLGIVPTSVGLPSAPVRRAFSEGLPAMTRDCARIDVVIEGDDFRMSVVRTLLRTMATLARVRNMGTFSTVESALAEWQRAGIPSSLILREWRAFETRNETAAA